MRLAADAAMLVARARYVDLRPVRTLPTAEGHALRRYGCALSLKGCALRCGFDAQGYFAFALVEPCAYVEVGVFARSEVPTYSVGANCAS